ncbi:hypothetical protein C7974DRAFT_410197 [Boeremia exigua]|uniref:uncharacterized protein n=1 Tax=Boeremia exigua TaxID=749465 RepID=UPI001E8D6AB6|nr:uncharacterized protein C7974DRAFT_410197 [Boeremia exigua]KAH6639214.1 hypothetical protein C7974DRAFT_410197 [Boeremia exigua]
MTAPIYHPDDCLTSLRSGNRCRVCCTTITSHALRVGGYCGGISCTNYAGADEDFRQFLVWCCLLQDFFKWWCKQRVPTRSWQPQNDLSAHNAWWWEMINVFHKQCEWSLARLAPHLQTFLAGGNRGITRIREIKFDSGPYYRYRHCAFEIHFASHGCWIYDPTGVQFGPDWPLLSPRHIYFACRPERRLLSSEPLGNNRQLLMST